MKLGVVVDGRGGSPAWRVEALGARLVSLPLVAGYDPTRYLETFRRKGWDVLLVLGPRALDDPGNWRASARRALLRVEELAGLGLVTDLALGHEPDDGWAGDPMADDPLVAPRGGVGSWVLSRPDLAELLHRARSRPRHGLPLWLGGLSSGRAEWLSGLDLSQLDGVLLHPYATADPGPLLDAVHLELAAQGQDGRVAVGIGELGRSDQTMRRGAIADWLGMNLGLLIGRGDVERAYVCCDSDLTLDGYGAFDAEERAKPAVAAVFRASALLATVGRPAPLVETETSPEPEPEDEPEAETERGWPRALPIPAEAMAEALADGEGSWALTHAVAGVWPLVAPHLDLYGVGDEAEVGVALAAAFWAATGGAFRSVTEEGLYDRCERLHGRDTPAGAALGNLRHGDGHRFRARGLLPIRGRAAYEQCGTAAGLDLVADPDLLAEPEVAVAVACAMFEANGLWEAARRGDYVRIGRVISAGLNGHEALVGAAQRLWAAVDAAWPHPVPDEAPRIRDVFARAIGQTGRPYRLGGGTQAGFDAGGLLAWAYGSGGGAALPTDPDAIAGWTAPIGPERAVAGDIVLYAYGDPSRGGARFAHVGMVTERADLVLDVRAGLGVGARPHIRGAVRRYRRVLLEDRLATEDEAMWQARYEEALGKVDELADRLERERTRLAARPPTVERPIEKAPKPEHVEYGAAMARHEAHVAALLDEADLGLEKLAGELRGLRGATETQPPDSTEGGG